MISVAKVITMLVFSTPHKTPSATEQYELEDTQYSDLTKQLRSWYLARLRKRADAANVILTPAALILADKQRLEQLITASPLKRNARLDPPKDLIGYAARRSVLVLLVLIQVFVCALLYAHSKDAFVSLAILGALSSCTGICLVANMQQDQRMKKIGSFLNDMNVGTPSSSVTNERSLEHLLTDLRSQWSSIEEHQNLIADYSEEVICTLDDSLNITCVAPSCFQAWGLTPQDLTGRLLINILANKDESSLSNLFSAGKGKMSEFLLQARVIGRNDIVIDTEWSVEWSNSARLFFAVIRDITAEAEIDRIKNEVIAIVSHDLRSPVTSIQWTLKALRDGLYGELNDVGRKRLKDAEETVEFLLDMIADILDLHRIEIGKPNLSYESVALSALVDESIVALQQFAGAKRIHLIGTATAGTCEVDKVRFKRVLINLISNAIKFSPRDTSITVEATSGAKDTTFVVADQGKGIPVEFVDKLFDRFCNVGNPAARREGSGLGLFASKAIIEAHGGHVMVESSDSGTRFRVVLPGSNETSTTVT